MKQPLEWTVGWAPHPDQQPDTRVPATVPGAVQLDWARAHGWGPHFVGDNWRDYGWMEDQYWSYETTLDFAPPAAGERLFFVCRGVDYRFQVRLNGAVLHDQEGMFTPFEIDLTGRATPGDALEVLVFPAPKTHSSPAGPAQANQSCKPAVAYGWDFHPRLIPLGIWDETYLETRPACHLRRVEVRYTLSPDRTRADLELEVDLSGDAGGRIRWQLLDRGGACRLAEVVDADAEQVVLPAVLEQPELWWPVGQGEPVLYTSRVELLDADERVVQQYESRVGFRTIRLVMYAGAWNGPWTLPVSRHEPPITLEINGRTIFCKGSNWVAPDIFPGTITADTLRPLLDLVPASHMNMLRMWGGAIVNKEVFFDLCDERGILVWQEFPLACNRYEGTPAYLRVLDQESRSIIRRLRPHPCVALWCGGNELFNAWSRMTDQDLALRLLNRNCYDLDPVRPFLPTSPIMGIGHGNYVFREAGGREVFEIFAQARATAYVEFGCPGPPSAEALRRIIPEPDLFPPRPGTAWETHHAIGAWDGDPQSWLMLPTIEDYFGAAGSLEDLVEHGQLLQSEGYKCLFEEARRQKPRCAMALNWCFNEPWPTAANNSLVGWPAEPKPALAAVAAACRPVLASARIPRFRWQAGDPFTAQLWLLNDGLEALPGGRLEAFLTIGGEEHFVLGWDFDELPAGVNLLGPVVEADLPAHGSGRLTLDLRVVGRPEWNSRYVLLLAGGTP